MTQFSESSMASFDAHDLKASLASSPSSVETPMGNQVESDMQDEEFPDNQCDDQDELEMETAAAASAPAKTDRRIAFSDADIIEFEPTLWTATVASDGVPVGLSSTVRRRTRRRLDSLEGERLLYRVNRQEYMEHGYLEPEERIEILESAGHSLAIMSHVERESMRVNRERWESNEYDLLYQFGLGEEAIMDLDEADELLLSQGAMPGYYPQEDEEEETVVIEDEDDEMLEAGDDDEEGNPAEYYYYTNRTAVQTDNQVGFNSMDEMDSYDTRKYEEWAWDYTTDCILGDDSDVCDRDGGFELPSLDFGLPEMSSSPTDVMGSGESLIVSCGKIIGSGSSSPSPSSCSKVASPRLFI